MTMIATAVGWWWEEEDSELVAAQAAGLNGGLNGRLAGCIIMFLVSLSGLAALKVVAGRSVQLLCAVQEVCRCTNHSHVQSAQRVSVREGWCSNMPGDV